MGNYLNILKESLEKKSLLLDRLETATKAQMQLLEGDAMSLEAYDAYVEEKSGYIEELTRLDEGFESLYRNLAAQLQQEKEKYRTQIRELQRQITEITEKSVSLQALEARNKEKVEAYFAREKKGIRMARKTSKAALDYYQNMNNSKNVQAQFLDKKK